MVRTRGHPFFGVVLGTFFIAVGIFMNAQASREEERLAVVSKWPRQSATIIGAELVRFEMQGSGSRNRVDSKKIMAYPRIIYRYEVDGRAYTNETQKPSAYWGQGFDYAYRMLGRFEPGSKAPVRVNPGNPYESELEGIEREAMAKGGKKIMLLASFVGSGFVIAGIIGTIRRRARRS